MAKSDTFFGLRHGSTKDLTFQTLEGVQITKSRVGKPKNPQTTAQMQQRVLMPLVANARAHLKGLVNHSWQDTEYGNKSLRKFSSLNLKKGNLTVYDYVPKGISDIGLANYIISKGSLEQPFGEITGLDQSGNFVFSKADVSSSSVSYWGSVLDGENTYGTFPLTSGSAESGVTGYLKLLQPYYGLSENEQLTFLSVFAGDDYTQGDLTGHYHKVMVSRLVFGENDDVNSAWSAVTVADNAILVTDGYVNVIFNEKGFAVQRSDKFVNQHFKGLEAAALVGSLYVDNVWQRSPARITRLITPANHLTFDDVLPTYLSSDAASSTKYLNEGSDTVNITGGNV